MRYRYTGPNSAVTLRVPDGAGGIKDQDVLLWNGSEVDLPDDHAAVKTLEAQKYLTRVAAPAQAPKAEAATTATATASAAPAAVTTASAPAQSK